MTKKIGTEEACSVIEVADGLRNVARTGWKNLDLKLVNPIYNGPKANPDPLLPQPLDIGEERLKVMDVMSKMRNK